MADKRKKQRKQRKQKRTKEEVDRQARKQTIKKIVEGILKKEKPKTIKELVRLTEEETDAPEKEILAVLREKELQAELTLQEAIEHPVYLPTTAKEYFLRKNYFAFEFWFTVSILILVNIFSAVNITEGFLFYLRYILVTFLMLGLSGWAFTAALFPELDSNLRFMERVATAIGFSILILIVDGIFLNFTFRFSAISITLSLSVIIIICMTIAILLRMKLARDGFIFKKQSKSAGGKTIVVEASGKEENKENQD